MSTYVSRRARRARLARREARIRLGFFLAGACAVAVELFALTMWAGR